MNVVARSATESSKQASERITRDVLSLDPGVQSGSAGSGWKPRWVLRAAKISTRYSGKINAPCQSRAG